MYNESVELSEMKLVGITTRTNNKKLFETNPATNAVAATVQNYFQNRLNEKILDRKAPNVTFCVYTQYESDYKGDYTYFIGEEVSSFDQVDPSMQTLVIPRQSYLKFTNEPGPMPDVCIDMWQKIWAMTDDDLGGERTYIADFEVYDERSIDSQEVVLDIYIGLK